MGLKRRKEPNIKVNIPDMINNPKDGVIVSMAKNMRLVIIKIKPAMLIGKVWSAKNASISEIVPIIPGMPTPGW